MVNVYLSGADARNAAADLWQSDQLKRLNDQFAPPPADTAQPLPSAPVEAAGDQGSSLPSPAAVGPAMTQPAPPAAVPAPAPVLPAAPNPTPDRNEIADHFTRNAVADAWEQNALADVTKGVSQAGAGVQSALADVPKEAQGLVSNLTALPGAQPAPSAQPAPGAISGIPAPQPTQGQVATVAGGGGTDVEQYIRQSAAAHGIEPDTAVRVAQSEGGLTNPVRQSDYVDPSTGQREQSFGPFQLYLGGGLGNAALKAGIDPRDPNQWRQAVDFALDQAARGGWSPWHGAARAGIGNFEGIGQVASSAGQAIASAGQTAGTAIGQAVGGPTRLDRTSQFQLGLSDADAYAACGPAAAIAFARAFGRNPTSQEAMQLASQSGWTSGGGMNGVVNEKKLMDAMGVPTTLETTVNWSKITSDAQNGNPVIVSTPGHYFTVDDAKQAQDGSTLYHVGTSGTDLRGGSDWMSAGEIQRRMGTANGALFADHPQASGPSITEQAAGVVRSVAAPVQQKAQDLLSTVGNIGSAIGTTASNVGGALNSPNLPSQIYQNSPIGAFNTATQQIGQNVISPALGAITQPGGPLVGPRTAAAGVLENAASNVPSGVPVVGGALQHAAGIVGGPTVIDQIGMVQDLANKYPSAVPGLPDVNRMTPQDQAQWSNLMIGVGGITGGEGAGAAERTAARGLPPNEPLATGAQPGQLGFGTELPLGGPRPADVEAVGPPGPQPGQLQIGSELPIGGPRPTGTEPLAPGARPGQLQFGSNLPVGGPAPVGGEALGPAGAQRGQMQIGSELPIGGPRPTGTEPLAPGAQPGQFQLGSELPLGGPTPTGTEAQGAAGGEFYRPPGTPTSPYPVAQQPALPGVQPPSAPTNPVTPWDIIRTGRVGSLAGGVPTVTHIALNTPLQAGWKLFSNAAQDIVERHPETIPMQFVGAWQGLRNWAMNASQTLTAPGQLAQRMGGGAGAQALETGLLGLVKTHPLLQDLAGQVGGSMELWRQAAKQATDSGLTRLSGPWQAEVQRLVSNPTPEMQAAVDQAQNTFALRGPMGFQGQKVADWLQNNELGRFVLPFFNIGYHVAAQGIERSPAGFIGTAYDVARSKLGSGPYAAGVVDKAVTPLAERFYNNLVGTGLFMEAYSQAAQGNITGNGPDDPAQRAELMSQGWMPNSTLVGGRWVDNHVLGPAGWALGEAANLAEARGDTPYTRGTKAAEQRQDGMQQAANYLTRMGTYLQDETFLRSFGQLLQAASSGAQAGRMGESVAASVAGSLVPQGALIANVASAQDPYARRAQPGDIAESLMTRLPGQREQVPARMNALGEPEQNPQYGAGILLPRSGTGQPSPVLTLLAGAGITLPATPPKDINYSGRQLTLSPDEQQFRQQVLGQRLVQTTQGYVNSTKFQALAPDQQKRALEPLVRAAEQYADQRVVAAMTPEDRRSRLALAPKTGAYAPVYPAAGSGLAGVIARQSAADADAAHQRLLAQYAGQSAQPQLAGVGP